MIGSLNKSFDYAIIIDPDRMKSLVDIIKSGFETISYEIKTVEGASYKMNTIENVVSYNNPTPRKIEKIVISANKQPETLKLFPDFSISLFDSSQYSSSCILTLNNMDEKDIAFWSQRIEEFVKSSRTSYWWVHKPVMYWALGALLYFVFFVWYYAKTGKDGLTNGLSTLSLMGISVFCFYISWRLIKKGAEYLFPEGGFMIGEQINIFQKREKVRSIVLISIAVSLVIGVISGIIVNCIVS